VKGAIERYFSRYCSHYLKPYFVWVWVPVLGAMVGHGLLLGLSSQSIDRAPGTAAIAAAAPKRTNAQRPAPPKKAAIKKPTYQDWVKLLRREAEAMAREKPENLMILAGDSLSLWFPERLLPVNQQWLNQGISGETSKGLMNRLHLWNKLKPERIFLMVGINDLLRGENDQVILANTRKILRTLRDRHPESTVVLQSILPNAGAEATWEGRAKLRSASNSRIRQLNQSLQVLTEEEGVQYIDLHNLLIDDRGNIREEYSTDGLHLNDKGYLVWSTALQVHDQIQRQIRAGNFNF
jgi:lysophospholipase L1-like esterase